MSEEKAEAQERVPTPEEVFADTETGTPAQPVEASTLVNDDTDRPKADNQVESDGVLSLEAPSGEAEAQPEAQKGKVGRPRLTPEQKAQRAAERALAKAQGRPPPDYSDIGKPGQAQASLISGKPPRDYQKEALSLFVPTSVLLGRWLGDHWGVKFDAEKATIEFTEDQKQYIASLAAWLEYEQFPELNARYAFIVTNLMYIAPRIHKEPTPERLKKAWHKIKTVVLGWFGKTVKPLKEQKEGEE